MTLGASPVTLTDTAALSGGYYETGTITFTLYLGSTLVDTESVSVSGNGTYTTPTGYTLPTTGAVTGTYQWDASFSGDTNNVSASESNATAEQTIANPAVPAITTTSSVAALTLGITPPTLKDTATLSGGYYPTGTITFTLYLGNSPVDTETVPVIGNGTYTTPTGYTLPTTGTVTGTYQWDASYSGDANNDPAGESNATAEQTVVSPASPAIATTSSTATLTLGTTAPTLKDTAVLSGGYYETGTITFTLYLGSALVDTETVSVNGNETYTTPTGYTLPTTGTVTGTYQWDASYSGDTNNVSASEANAPAERTTVNPAGPAITTISSVAALTLGTTPPTLKDTATLSGGYYETGSITFTLYLGSTLVDTETVAVSGNGTYSTPTGYTLPTTGTVTGTYQWDASFSGDTNNNSAAESNATAEQTIVSTASPTIATTPSAIGADARDLLGHPERHGRALGRLLRDRHDHLHPLPGQHAGRHRVGRRERERHVHGAGRLRAPDDGDRHRHLSVGCHLQRRHQRQPRLRPGRRGRADGHQPGQSDDRDDLERRLADPGDIVAHVEGHGDPVRRLLRDGHDHLHAVPRQHAGRHRVGSRERQRDVHDSHGLHPAHHRDRDRYLPVGRQLQRRFQ